MKAARRLLLGCVLLAIGACDRGVERGAGPTSRAAPPTEIVRTAERGPVRLTVKADRAEVNVPEHLTVTVAVEAEIGVEVTMPESSDTLGDFAVAGISDADPTSDGQVQRRQRVYTLDGVIPGPCDVPAISVAFTDSRPRADGSTEPDKDQVKTEPIRVTVRQGLADVKGPASLPLSWRYKALLWGLVVVAAMVAVALAARWWRRRRERMERELPWARRLIAHKWALEELDKLAAENLVGRGLVQEFYYRINGLLRRYIELRFGLAAGEQTSEEFIRALQHAASFDPRHKEVLRRFVETCDPVKYARYRPEPSEIDWVHTAAREFVLQTAQRADEDGSATVVAAGASRGGSDGEGVP